MPIPKTSGPKSGLQFAYRNALCVPAGEAGGEAEGKFQEAEGTGLGEGQGKKDVSDEIENEDQVTGAKQQGAEEEKNEEGEGQRDEQDAKGEETS